MEPMKSDIDIKTDVFNHIKNSALAKAVSGVVRKNGKRPHNSKKEDIIISVLANVNGQIQRATVNVNIYTSAQDDKGQAVEDDPRLKKLCDLASSLFEVFHGKDFRASLTQQRVFEVEGANEYVINNQIEYKQNNE